MPREPRPVPVYKQRRIAAEQAKRAEMARNPKRLAIVTLDVHADGVRIGCHAADGSLFASYAKMPMQRLMDVELSKLIAEIHAELPRAPACAVPVR